MRSAVILLAGLVVAGCGSAPQSAQHVRSDIQWPTVAQATRTQWYRGVEAAAAQPVTLSEGELEAALRRGAETAAVTLLSTRYLPLLGGTAELVLQPSDPDRVADEASGRLSPVLGPLGRDNRPYLVTVVDAQQRALLVLGWTPNLGGGIGEGVAWQAPGIRSNAIVGQVETEDDSGALPAAVVRNERASERP